MKNLLIAATLLATLFSWSCNKPSAGTGKKTIVEVKIKNFIAQPGNNRFVLEVGDLGGDATTFTITVHQDTTFRFVFDQYIAQDIKITPYIESFICHPGDKVGINYDYKQPGEVKFSGDGEETNTQLHHYITENYSYFDDGNAKLAFKTLDAANYRAVYETMRDELFKKREEFINTYNANDEVKTWTKNYINIRYYKALYRFSMQYNFTNARQNPYKTLVPLQGFTPDKSTLDEIYNTSLLNTESYEMLKYMSPPKMTLRRGDSVIRVKMDPKAETDQSKQSPLIKQLLAGTLFSMLLRDKDLQNFDKRKPLFDSVIKEPFIKQPLTKYYALVKKSWVNPKEKSDVMVNYANGTEARNIIDGIRTKYKGKVVFVNFWATWCGPCLGEMPYEKKLEEKLKGKDVVFVSICVDSPQDAWKEDVKKFQLSGPQLYFDAKQSGKIIQGFDIKAFPQHMLFNQNGDIQENSIYLGPNALTLRKINDLLSHPTSNPIIANRDSIQISKLPAVKQSPK